MEKAKYIVCYIAYQYHVLKIDYLGIYYSIGLFTDRDHALEVCKTMNEAEKKS